MHRTTRLPLYITIGAAVSAAAVTTGVLVASSSGASKPTGAADGSTLLMTGSTGLGQILVDGSGRTVYLFEQDMTSKPTCTGSCAAYWPPVPASATMHAAGGASAAKLGTVAEPGGGRQLSYAGHPLYYFIGDRNAGATSGEGLNQFGAKWYALDAAGQAVTQAPANTGSSNSSGTGSGSGY